MRIAIIDCGAGNLHSVRKAFARQLPQDAQLEVVTEAAALAEATHIVLPGVGAFADCMAGLDALPHMRAALEEAVLKHETPFLGICVGMQMLFERGHEHGTHAGLGWFKGEVRPIAPSDAALRIPHMGWNRLRLLGGGITPTPPDACAAARDGTLRGTGESTHPFFDGIADGYYVYFVHSFAAQGCARDEVLASVDYGGEIVSVVGRKNIVATQFHPEKSQAVGLRMIGNFLAM